MRPWGAEAITDSSDCVFNVWCNRGRNHGGSDFFFRLVLDQSENWIEEPLSSNLTTRRHCSSACSRQLTHAAGGGGGSVSLPGGGCTWRPPDSARERAERTSERVSAAKTRQRGFKALQVMCSLLTFILRRYHSLSPGENDNVLGFKALRRAQHLRVLTFLVLIGWGCVLRVATEIGTTTLETKTSLTGKSLKRLLPGMHITPGNWFCPPTTTTITTSSPHPPSFHLTDDTSLQCFVFCPSTSQRKGEKKNHISHQHQSQWCSDSSHQQHTCNQLKHTVIHTHFICKLGIYNFP